MQEHEKQRKHKDGSGRAVPPFDRLLQVASEPVSSQIPADAAETTTASHRKGNEEMNEKS